MKEGFLRNFVFGIEDGLVSTVGFVSGIASTTIERSTILLTGAVLIAVEGFSMGIGSVLSDTSVHEWSLHTSRSPRRSIFGGLIMFISYIAAGLLVLVPYVLWKERAEVVSVSVSLGMLFFLGVFSAKISHLPILRRGIRMTLIGGMAIVLGIAVAKFLPVL